MILRFPQILEAKINELHQAFKVAISESGYQSHYRGLFPIKVNQDREIVEQVAEIGTRLDHGLEVGSKGELIAAMGTIKNRDSMLVVNGYKDAEFIDLALVAQRIGFEVTIVMETPDELDLITARAANMDITPRLGLRLRLSTRPGGRWCQTNEIFGLTSTEAIAVVDRLKSSGQLGWLKMIHFHQGSQLGQLESIREGAREGARAYAALYREGADLEMLNVGGGLALNYDGSKKDPNASKDYGVRNYAKAIVETVGQIFDDQGIPHPTLLSESGRAVCAQHCVFVLNLHSLSSYLPVSSKPADPASLPDQLRATIKQIGAANLQSFLKNRSAWADRIDEMFMAGEIDLRQRAAAETELRLAAVSLANTDEETEQLEIHDIAYANFSVFQSLPDHWGIRQKFPVMPLQRLNAKPKRLANISDLTCDCDGRLRSPSSANGENSFIPIHTISPNEDYFLGVFLTGAYQEALGGTHNLFGRTPSVSVRVTETGFEVGYRRSGQSASDVLANFDYDRDALARRVTERIAEANREGKISGEEGAQFINSYRSGLSASPYLSGRGK